MKDHVSGITLVFLAGLLPACSAPTAPAPGAAPAAKLEPAACGSIARLHTLDGVFLAGQPTADDFEQLEQCGIKTVINLRTDQERKDFDERTRVTGLGLVYQHLPWNGVDQLTDEVFARTRELLAKAERPILLHCASANRVGAVWIPWRVLDGGLDLEAAVAEARQIGLKTAEYESKARDYVARHARR